MTPEKAAAAATVVGEFGEPPRRRLSWVRVGVAVLAVTLVAGAMTFVTLLGRDRAAASASETPAEISPYVDVTNTPVYNFEEPVGTAAMTPTLGFVVAAGKDSCTPSWGTYYSLTTAEESLNLDRRIARLRQLGGDVSVSFGGAANTELAVSCTDQDALLSAYSMVVQRYQLTQIDLDIEGEASSEPAAVQRRATAIAALQRKQQAAGTPLTVWLTLPVTPTGLTAVGEQVLKTTVAAGVKVAGVNVMAMDFGTSKAATMSESAAAIAAATATQRQLVAVYAARGIALTDREAWRMVGVTPMIGQNDVTTERFTIADATALADFVRRQGLGRIAFWSLNRDVACGPNYAEVSSVSNSCSGVEQTDGQFGQILAAAGGPRAATTGWSSPTSTQAPTPTQTGGDGRADANTLQDDPATSPYQIWKSAQAYVKGTKVVWHHNVYQAKWWTQGDTPDAPVSSLSATPWQLVGPVLPGDHPATTPTLPSGTYPEWSAGTAYEKGQRVLYDNIGYEAKWWTQGDVPGVDVISPSDTPWQLITPARSTGSSGSTGEPPTAQTAAAAATQTTAPVTSTTTSR